MVQTIIRAYLYTIRLALFSLEAIYACTETTRRRQPAAPHRVAGDAGRLWPVLGLPALVAVQLTFPFPTSGPLRPPLTFSARYNREYKAGVTVYNSRLNFL